MHKSSILILFFTFFALTSCFNIQQGGVAGRWDFEAIDMPDVAGFIDSVKSQGEEVKETMEGFFRGDELVLRKDNTYDLVLCKKYLHGTWKFDEKASVLTLTDEAGYIKPVLLKVNKIEGSRMLLSVDNENMVKLIPPYQYSTTGYSYLISKKRYTFFLSADDDSYWQDKNDPYSKANNLWRIKPHKAETDEQVTQRVSSHLKFCKLAIEDAMGSKRGYLSFNWFVTPLILSSRGGYLREYDHVKEEWESNFYDSTQALQGYKMLEASQYKSSYKADETKSRFDNYLIIINQFIENLRK